jgi:hypothetical protein
VTVRTNARVAGAAFLIYIAAGLSTMAIESGSLLNIVLTLVQPLCAFVLGVTLYRLTRDQDADVAMLGAICRVAEGVIGAAFLSIELGAGAGASSPAADVARAAGRFNGLVSATFFAFGSTCFCWLLLRGRIVPAPLAWLGLVASLLLVCALPVQLAGALPRSLTMPIWMPMLVFELTVAAWFIVKGAAPPHAAMTRPIRASV